MPQCDYYKIGIFILGRVGKVFKPEIMKAETKKIYTRDVNQGKGKTIIAVLNQMLSSGMEAA